MLPRLGQRVARLGSLCWYSSDAWAPAKARLDEALIRALARAHRWNRMLEAGKCRLITEIAEAEKIGRSFISRLLRLTLLAPNIQEAILEGRQSKGMQLDGLMGPMPGAWEEQRAGCRWIAEGT